jgi:hypothetical protein
VSEPVGFNDPEAWGYCKFCAFQVARDMDTGNLLPHMRRTGSWDTERCYGSLMEPSPQPGPEAKKISLEEDLAQALEYKPDAEVTDHVVRGSD